MNPPLGYMQNPHPFHGHMPQMTSNQAMLYVGDLHPDVVLEEIEPLFRQFGDCTLKLCK